jgi:hypothetical protein
VLETYHPALESYVDRLIEKNDLPPISTRKPLREVLEISRMTQNRYERAYGLKPVAKIKNADAFPTREYLLKSLDRNAA